MLYRTAVFFALGLLTVTGCSRTLATPVVLREQTVNISTDNPSVTIDGQKIGVDGAPPGETVPLKVTHFRTSDGKIGVDVDSASEK